MVWIIILIMIVGFIIIILNINQKYVNEQLDKEIEEAIETGKEEIENWRKEKNTRIENRRLVRYTIRHLTCNYWWDTKFPRIPAKCPQCNKSIDDNHKILHRWFQDSPEHDSIIYREDKAIVIPKPNTCLDILRGVKSQEEIRELYIGWRGWR